MKQIIRHIFYGCFTALLYINISSIHAAGAGMPYGMPAMNEHEMMGMLDELDHEIAKLSPEERKNFDQMVESFGESLMTMSDDEFDRFIGGQMPEEEIIDRFGHIGPKKEEVAETKEADTPQEPTAPIVEVKPPSKESVQAVRIIETIINRTESLMRKMPPDISFKLTSWLGTGALKHWQSTDDWIAFEYELERFKAKLARVRDERDAGRKQIYIDALLANKQLYQNLDQLRAALEQQEGKIGERSLTLSTDKELKPQEETALRTLLDKYAEALHLLKLAEGIDEIFKSYEPTEKQLLAAEEAAQKKAEEYRGPQRGASVTAGSAGKAGDYGADYGGLGDLRDPYSSYGRGGGGPSYREAPSQKTKSDAQKEAGKGPLGGVGGNKDDTKPGLKNPLGDKKGKNDDAKAKDPLKDQPIGKTIPATEANKLVDEIYTDLKKAADSISAARKVLPNNNQGFANHITSATPLATGQQGVDRLANKKIAEAGQVIRPAFEKVATLDDKTKELLKTKLNTAEAKSILQPLRDTQSEVTNITEQGKPANDPQKAKYLWYITGSRSETVSIMENLTTSLQQGNPQALDPTLRQLEECIVANQAFVQKQANVQNTFQVARRALQAKDDATFRQTVAQISSLLDTLQPKLPDIAKMINGVLSVNARVAVKLGAANPICPVPAAPVNPLPLPAPIGGVPANA